MPKYRHALPQTGKALFVTDGGLETTLIYEHGIDLPAFAAFDLLKDDAGVRVLRKYYERYAQLARTYGLGLILESPTWRANADWGARLGYDAQALATANREAIDLMMDVRESFETHGAKAVVSGNVGPRGDGYRADTRMSSLHAYMYHVAQIKTFAQAGADMVAAFTMNYVEEAIGIVMAARVFAMPVAISFTLETDGRLPSGQTLADAIDKTDAETDGYAAYYMINCAHPSHFARVLERDAAWVARIRGVRANASTRSHAELDACTNLDAGDPHRLGLEYRALAEALPNLTVIGGCCGTDHRHVGEMCEALAPRIAAAA